MSWPGRFPGPAPTPTASCWWRNKCSPGYRRCMPRFWAGRIDFVKAEAFTELVYDLDDETTRRVADRLLDRADRWTLADLRERLRYHAGRADPNQAKKRYQRKVADRDVRAHADPDGTACLAGSNLPPDQALAAQNRVARLARTARAGGDPRNDASTGRTLVQEGLGQSNRASRDFFRFSRTIHCRSLSSCLLRTVNSGSPAVGSAATATLQQ